MKKMNKIFALLIAMVMVVCMSTSAFAAMINVENAVNGQTYTAYKVFEVSKSEDGAAVSYYLTSAEYEAYGADLVTFGVTFVESSDGTRYYVDPSAEFPSAAAFATNLNTIKDKLTVAGSAIGAAADAEASNVGTATIEVADAGYYFIDSSMGAVCALLDADAEFTMIEKNAEPTVSKDSSDDQDVSYSIGDDIPFTITITAGGEADTTYILTDTMSEGLTLNADSIVITPEAAASAATIVTSEHGFTITFSQEYTSTLVYENVITVEYTAKLNENAVVADIDGNTNDVDLQYGQTHTVDTDTTHVDVATGSMEVTKYGNEDKTNLLSGAQFVILKDGKYLVSDWAANTYVDGTEDWKEIEEGYDWNTVPADAYVLTTDNEGKAKIEGLAAGSYQLLEVVAPEGYNKLEEAIDFVINAESDTALAATEEVNNNSGTILPSTGGMGTTILYVVGGILVVAAVVLLFVKRRVEEN